MKLKFFKKKKLANLKREIIVDICGKELTKEERRSFKKDHPGYRLCFRLRYPNVLYIPPFVMSIAALIISIVQLLK